MTGKNRNDLSYNKLNIYNSLFQQRSYKYKVQATKSGPNTYFLVMNGSFKEIEVHRLSDGGNTATTHQQNPHKIN